MLIMFSVCVFREDLTNRWSEGTDYKKKKPQMKALLNIIDSHISPYETQRSNERVSCVTIIPQKSKLL
jgi:hypothetical protein